MNENTIRILMADDDEDDRLLFQDAMQETRVANSIDFVVDGADLMHYLLREGAHAHRQQEPYPGLILLDLNMPKKDGMTCLQEIKGHPQLRLIPVIILTTSSAEEDVFRSYDLGVNSFITKPVTFEQLVKVVCQITEYWFEVVRTPSNQ